MNKPLRLLLRTLPLETMTKQVAWEILLDHYDEYLKEFKEYYTEFFTEKFRDKTETMWAVAEHDIYKQIYEDFEVPCTDDDEFFDYVEEMCKEVTRQFLKKYRNSLRYKK